MQIQVIGSNSMSVSEMIKQAIAMKGLQQKEIAVKMGWSPQNFTNRLTNNTIDAEEWVKLAAIIGYEIQMVDVESNTVLKPRRNSTGPRVKQTIDGHLYDTDKADSLCRSPKVYGGWFELFRDMGTGKFFTVAYLETGRSACVAVISKENAKRFYEDCGGEDAQSIFKD